MMVDIVCPSCNTPGNIEIPKTLVENTTRGLLFVDVPSKLICEHTFQVFLDKNGVVRGYQRVDFQVGKQREIPQAESRQNLTGFRCKLCDLPMNFQIDDEKSYVFKQRMDDFLGSALVKYQVAHVEGNEMHLNTVIVDATGEFLGHIDAYAVPLSEFLADGKVTMNEPNLIFGPEGYVPLKTHKFLEILLFLNTKHARILELISPGSLNIVEVGRLVEEKVQETKKIYLNISENVLLNIADKNFRIWISGDNILVASINTEGFLAAFDMIAKQLVQKDFEEIVERTEPLKIALKFLEKPQSSSKDLHTFFRLYSDDRLFSRIRVKYPENIPRILERLKKEFKTGSELLDPFLNGQKSLIEILGSDIITRAWELFELIDFIDRRKLLS
ncbi:MAG TPA: hypothetical protein VKK79_04005 [Candidatus Lokiarchaeia archaeon]|nr:hypothetical protein [Candidatus Lokiarchaeia archaeon]